jgi:GDPmannose 4,6-dehydratase
VIIGSDGQDGRLLTGHLRSKNYDLTLVTRFSHDISDPVQVENIVRQAKPTEIYYLAAHHRSSEGATEPGQALLETSFGINVLSPGFFLESIVSQRPDCRMFYASSSHVFSGSAPGKLNENHQKKPESIYAITKHTAMQLCSFYRTTHGTNASCGILFNHESVYRPSGYLSKKISRAVATISRQGHGNLELGDLEAVVDWGAAEDYVDAMHRILQVGQGGDYVVATGVPHTVGEFVDLAFRHVGLDYRNHVTIRPAVVTRKSVTRIGDPAKLMRDTGWDISIRFDEMVARLVDHELKDN